MATRSRPLSRMETRSWWVQNPSRGCTPFRLTRVKMSSGQAVHLYELANRIPSMGGMKIGPVLRQVARDAPGGTSIVEVGCWLGAACSGSP